MHPRTRRRLEALPPEARAAAEAAIARSAARRATPEGQAEQEDVIRKVREEFPPLAIDPELAKALAALRAERERQGLSLGCPVCAHFVHYTSRRNRVPPRRGFRVEVQ